MHFISEGVTVPNCYSKIVERGTIHTPNTYVHDKSLYWSCSNICIWYLAEKNILPNGTQLLLFEDLTDSTN